jgi:hypothetical protein
MASPRAAPSGPTFIVLVVAVAALLCAPARGQAGVRRPVVSFNRAQNAASIADALDHRLDEERSGDAPPAGHPDGNSGGFDNRRAPEAPVPPDPPRGAAGGGAAAQDPPQHPAVRRADVPADNPEYQENEDDYPKPGPPNAPLQAHEMVSVYRDLARDAIGDGRDLKVANEALARQAKSLEALVLKVASADPAKLSAADRRQAVSLCEDTKFQLREQTRAFDELLEEKTYLSQMLKDEQAALDSLQEKVQNPDLSQWIKRRAKRVSHFFETPETDAVAYYAQRFLQPQVSKARHRIRAFEDRLEQTVDVVLPPKYGSLVAVVLALFIVLFPCGVTLSAMASIHKAISLRQHVLLCNLFMASFAVGVAACGVLLRDDPLKTLYAASESAFICLQFCLFLLYVVSIVMLARALYHSRDERDMIIFGSQLIFYVLVGYNYHQRVIQPALLGFSIDTSATMYLVYVVDFVVMTGLTVSSATPNALDGPGLPRHSVLDGLSEGEFGRKHGGGGGGGGGAGGATSSTYSGVVAGSTSLSRLANDLSSAIDAKQE